MRFTASTQSLMAPAEAPEAAAVAAPAGNPPETAQETEQAPVDIIDALYQRISPDAGEPSSTTEEEVEDSPVATADEEEGDQEQQQEEQEPEPETDTEEEESEEAEQSADDEEEESEEGEAEEDEQIDLKDLDPKARKAAQRVIQREIGKIRAKKQAAEARAEELQGKVTTFETETQQLQAALADLEAAKVVPAPTSQDPLSKYTDNDSLQRLEDSCRAFKRWAIENPDGGPCPFILDKDKEPVALTQQQVRSMQANADDDLDVYIPRRRAWLGTNAQFDQQTVQLFPQLRDKTHELTVAVNDVLRSAPEFKRHPGARMGAVFYELGRRLVEKHKGNAWELVNGKAPAAAPEKSVKRIPVKGKHRPAPVPAASSPARVPRSQAAVATGEPLDDSAVVDRLSERFG